LFNEPISSRCPWTTPRAPEQSTKRVLASAFTGPVFSTEPKLESILAQASHFFSTNRSESWPLELDVWISRNECGSSEAAARHNHHTWIRLCDRCLPGSRSHMPIAVRHDQRGDQVAPAIQDKLSTRSIDLVPRKTKAHDGKAKQST
jgi:hypothetical protein